RHWYDSEPPEAPTVNVAEPPTLAVWLMGWDVIDGAASTVSSAAELVAVPHVLVATQSYDPVSLTAAAGMVYIAPVSPGMGTSFLRHRRPGAGVPETATLNPAGLPSQTVCEEGWPVNDGAVFTVSVAAAEVAPPHTLVATQS